MKRFIFYFRVSTDKQQRSGLGIEAQRAAARQYVASIGGGVVAAEYVETESGKLADRPVLRNALAHAHRAKAVLVIAKLDRLARSVAFVSAMMEAGVDFVCCDNPHANRFTLHILAAVAEHEARMISQRTKEALEAAKKRGVLLGSRRPGHWDGKEHIRAEALVKGRAAAIRVKKDMAVKAYEDLYGQVGAALSAGRTCREIASDINAAGHTTRTGLPWTRRTVMNVMGIMRGRGLLK